MYGYIYKTTNLINGKIYIGQHKHSCWDDKYLGSGTMLFRAIDKYGINNFKCELLESVNSQEELNNREKYYIELFNARDNSIGYNIAAGGIGGSHEPWNKGKTKDTDEIVKSYSEKRKKIFDSGENIGCFGLKGELNKNSIEYKGIVEKILPEFEDYWKFHTKSEVCAYFHTTPKAYNICVEKLGLNENDSSRQNFLREKRNNKRNATIEANNSSNKVRIRCVETGEIYNSIIEAKHYLKLSSCSSLHNALSNGKRCRGFHWERI